jgi:prophage DNA circulation protein
MEKKRNRRGRSLITGGAFMSERREASLDGHQIEAEFFKDSIPISIVKNEYPYKDGAKLRNLGQKARSLTFKCFFYDETFDDHIAFLNDISVTGDPLHELHHPDYGIIKGKIENIETDRTFEFDRKIDITVTFTEDMLSQADPLPFGEVAAVCDALLEKSLTEQISACSSDVLTTFGAQGRDIANKIIDQGTSLVNSFVDASLGARATLGVMDDVIATAGSVASLATIPSSSILSIIDFPLTAPGRIVQSFAVAAGAHAAALSGLNEVPSRYIGSLCAALSGCASRFSDDVFPFRSHFLCAAAQVLAVEVAHRYSEDESRRAIVKINEELPAFDIEGRSLSRQEMEPILTINELETTLAQVRAFIQAAVIVKREVASLRKLAEALLSHVNIIKLDRERIVERDVYAEMPLHLICLREGLPYQYAERLLSINPRIKNPTFVRGKVSVYALR